jgi:hypothetical protein
MKEIIKGAVVIDPTFRSEVTLVTVKKSRVFVMALKFNQRKMVSLHHGAKPGVIIFASRTRHPLAIVKVAGYWHTKQQRASVKPCERAQEQFQIGPAVGRIHVVLKFRVTMTMDFFFVQTRSLCRLVFIGPLGSAYGRNKLLPIEQF